MCLTKDGEGAELLAKLLEKHLEAVIPFVFLDKNAPGAHLIPDVLQRCSRLAGLCLEGYQTNPFASDSLPPIIPLRTFSLIMVGDMPLTLVVQIMQQALARCPELDFIGLEIPQRSSAALGPDLLLETIKPLFLECEGRAIRSVTVTTCDSELVKPLAERVSRLGWTKITVAKGSEKD